MPTIINAYGANDSIANSLAKLGESMFGNGARDEAARQQAKSVEQDVAKKSRENAFTPLIASRVANHDYEGALSAGVNAGMNPAHLGGYQQYYDVNKSGPASDLGTRATMSVPGANYGNTVPGTREHEASAEGIAAGHDATTLKANDMTTQRQMDLAKWADTHTLVPLQSPDGTRIINVPKSEVTALQSQGYQVAPSMDQVKARLVAPAQQPMPGAYGMPSSDLTRGDAVGPAAAPAGLPDYGMAQPPAPQQPVPAAGPAAPSGLSALTQDQRSIVGLPTGTQHFINPQTGEVAVSHDGGQTLTTQHGVQVPPTGYQPVDSSAALTQVRNNNMRNEVRMTPTPKLDITNSALAQDAYKASGMDAGLTRHLNNSVGAIPGVGPLIGEIGAPTNRATENLTVAANAARTALLTNEFRQSKWSQQQIDSLLPIGRSFENPVTAANSLSAVVRELGMEEAHLRQVIESPNTPPDLQHKAFAAWQQTHRAITLFTAPPAAAPAAPAQQPATAAAPPQLAAPAPQAQPATQADPLAQARAAIAQGAPREAVIQRLQQNGINPAGL